MTSLLEAFHVAVPGRLEPLDLEVAPGELIVLIGPNGSGKTSLLRALAGVEQRRGSVRIAGEDLISVAPARRSRLLGFLPASRDLAWPIASRDLIGLGLPSPDPAGVEELIQLLELERFADKPADCLSTGERARVLLARALVARPALLLLDEPLSNLDPYWVLRILAILRELTEAGECSAIVAVHDLAVVERFDRAILMDRGRVVEDALPRTVLANSKLGDAFGIEQDSAGWQIRPKGDRQSSP
ncbi:MAG: ABC transporter ATP-binding protein [Pseudomonadota bacterium]|nr:ABC transporter ATP-binding protein [Pseudomonadota bacterium]